MASLDLTLPAIADVYFSVGGVDAVADDEVVGEPVLHSAVAPVVMLHAADAVVAVGAVVDDDVLPAVAPDARPVDLAQGRTGDGGRLGLGWFAGRAFGDLEFLAGLDGVWIFDAVGLGDRRCGGFIFVGDRAQRVALLDGVSERLGLGRDDELPADLDLVGVGDAVVGGECQGAETVFFGDDTKRLAALDGVGGRLAKHLAKPQGSQQRNRDDAAGLPFSLGQSCQHETLFASLKELFLRPEPALGQSLFGGPSAWPSGGGGKSVKIGGCGLGRFWYGARPFLAEKGLLKPDRTPTETAFKTQPWAWLPEEALTTTN